MKVTIASGKGGTGKTTVATNLAMVAAGDGESVQLLDCDVEEPNCHLFLNPRISHRSQATVPVPVVDWNRCTGCGDCAAICEFNAIACLDSDVLVFTELCHGCGGCWLVCAEQAITRGKRTIGDLEEGRAGRLKFVQGRLRIGETQVPPLIEQVLSRGGRADLVIIDAPPGTTCPTVAAMRGSDYVVLVTEPTPFGFHDLELAVSVTRQLAIPCGVVVNKVGIGDERVQTWCRRESIPLLAEIPDDRRIAEAYARGELVVQALPEFAPVFSTLRSEIVARCRRCPA